MPFPKPFSPADKPMKLFDLSNLNLNSGPVCIPGYRHIEIAKWPDFPDFWLNSVVLNSLRQIGTSNALGRAREFAGGHTATVITDQSKV